MGYKLAFPPGSQIYNVFHVETNTAASTQLPAVTDDSTILPQLEVVLNRCVLRKGKYRPRFEILVK